MNVVEGSASGSPTSWRVRVATTDDWPAVVRVGELAFAESQSPEERALERSVHELDRTLLACDGPEVVGVAAAYTFRMTVPGGPAPVAGVTWVSVLPTHRRRGVLTALMREQLEGMHREGREPVAALWASEPGIYGRFGYGAASRALRFEVPRGPRALLPQPHDPTLRLRLVEPEESRDLVEPAYDAVRSVRPGFWERDERWRQRELFDHESVRTGASPLRCVVAEGGDGVRGYARYRTRPSWGQAGPEGTVEVREALAVDPAAYAALLRFLADQDLTRTLSLVRRPLDDPLLELLTDVRSAKVGLADALFVRLVDVERALTARSYATDLDVVLAVADPVCPRNEGRWRLRTWPGGASCERTGDPPDLELPVQTLGAAYLGSARALVRAQAAGQLQERTAGAVHAADRAFTGALEPWCPVVF